MKKIIKLIINTELSMKFLKKLVFLKINTNKDFKFNQIKMEYFFHSYNNFRLTPRCIEIPIIKHYLATYIDTNVLEFGNVTKHYYDDFKQIKRKETLDKYEIAYDVINLDIKDYVVDKKFDFIYSISVFEHMDSDGNRNPDYSPILDEKFTTHAFKNINHVVDNLLTTGGVHFNFSFRLL